MGKIIDGTVVVGITDHAQDALGDIVFIELQSQEMKSMQVLK